MTSFASLLATDPRWMLNLGGLGLLAIAAAVGLSLLAWWLYRRQLRDASRWRRTVLPMLRGLAVFAIALMLAEPSLQWSQTIERRGRVVLIDDSSPSMQVPDLQMSIGRKVLIAQALDLADTSGIDFTQVELAERLRTATGQAWQEAVDLIAALPSTAFTTEQPRGHATAERWERIGGHAIREFERQGILDRPMTEIRPVPSLILPEDIADNFARRVHGRLHPPVSGSYVFRLAADATAELRLSTGSDPANLRQILEASEKTAADDDNTYVSDPIPLRAGQSYAFELLHKDGTGPDHLTLWWGLEEASPRIPAGQELSPAGDPPDPASLREAFLADLQELSDAEEISDDLRDTLANRLLEHWNSALSAALAEGDEPIATAVAAFDAQTRQGRINTLLNNGLEAEIARHATVVRHNLAAEQMTDLVTPLTMITAAPEAPTAVVLLTDGRHTESETDASQAVMEAVRLGQAGVAIHSVVVGSMQPPRDVAVLDVVGPTFVGPDDHINGRIILLENVLPGTPLRVEASVDADGKGEAILWSHEFTATGAGRREIEFGFQPPEAIGEEAAESANEVLLPVTFRFMPVPGELSEDNNSALMPVRVALRRGRVLLLDGRPRWDSRYAAAALERESRFEATRLLTLGADPEAAEAFPESEEAVREYDVIVLGEVPVDAFTEEQIGWLERFVTERGGGIVFIDGQRGVMAEYARTPLATLLPVYRREAAPIEASSLRLTDAGRGSPVLRLEPDSERNNVTWRGLPAPMWALDTEPKPGVGEVLVELVNEEDEARPAVVTASVGRGRVWYVGFDETWRWRKDAENRWQSRFWSGLINAAAEPPFSAEDDHLAIGIDQAAVEAGDEIAVRVRVKDDHGRVLTGESLAELRIEAQLLRDGVAIASVPLSPDAAGGGLLRGTFPAPADPGLYEVAAFSERTSDPLEDPRAQILVTGVDEQAELARLDADVEQLQAISNASDGRMFLEETAAEIPALFEGFSSTTTISGRYDVWTSWPLFAAAVGLLGIEWLIRRRGGMM